MRVNKQVKELTEEEKAKAKAANFDWSLRDFFGALQFKVAVS